MGIQSYSWVHGLGVALALMLAPAVRVIWKKISDHDERRIAEYEEKREQKLAEKAARKAAKLEAQKDRYTSATVVGPPRIGFDGDRTPPESTGESKSQR